MANIARNRKQKYNSKWQRVRPLVLDRDDHRCQIRGEGCDEVATQVDHIVPLSRGGSLLDPDNLQAACQRCNSRKNDRVSLDEPASSVGPSREW